MIVRGIEIADSLPDGGRFAKLAQICQHEGMCRTEWPPSASFCGGRRKRSCFFEAPEEQQSLQPEQEIGDVAAYATARLLPLIKHHCFTKPPVVKGKAGLRAPRQRYHARIMRTFGKHMDLAPHPLRC